MTLSVICASIGRSSLIHLVPELLSADFVDEFLLVLPPNFSFNPFLYSLTLQTDKRFIILNASSKGQVNQRVFGVRHASGSALLFIDDDIFLSVDDLRILYTDFIFQPSHVVLAPRIKFTDPAGSICRNSNLPIIFLNLISYFDRIISLGMARHGFSFCYFHEPHNFKARLNGLIPVNWIPGGCIMMSAIYSPNESYYSFIGKSYSEDIYLSYYLKSLGCSLFLHPFSSCTTPYPQIAYDYNYRQFAILSIFLLANANSLIQLIFTVISIPVNLFFSLITFYFVRIFHIINYFFVRIGFKR